MDFSLSELQRSLQESVVDFALGHGDYERRRALMNSDVGYSEDDWAEMGELGWLALLLPEEYGGIGGGPIEAMLVMEALGKSLALEPYLSTAVLSAGCVLKHGDDAQKAEILPALAEGTLRVALAHSEDGAYQNRTYVATCARPDRSRFILDGAKHSVFDAPSAQRLIVSARTSGSASDREGITLFLVDTDAPGVERVSFRRIDGGRASHVKFNSVEISPASALGGIGEGAPLIDDIFARGIGAVCGEALGAMQTMHDITLAYLKTRKQFGRPIGSFQALQHRQVDMYSALEEARSLTLAANMALADGLPQSGRLLSMAKAMVGRACKIVGQGAVQLHGGIGMADELNVGAYFKRATVIDMMFGTAQQHLSRLASDVT